MIAVAQWPGPVGHFLNTASPLLVALATIAIACYTKALWDATRAMKEGADSTLAHLQESSRQELRAYVSWCEVEPLPGSRPGRYFTFKNYGRTPADWVQVAIGQCISTHPDPTLPPPALDSGGAIGTLMPGQESPPMTIPYMHRSPKDHALLNAGTHRHYLYGIITYRDVFYRRCTVNLRWEMKINDVIVLSGEGNRSDYDST